MVLFHILAKYKKTRESNLKLDDMTDIGVIRSQDEQIPFCIFTYQLHSVTQFTAVISCTSWISPPVHVQGENSEILEIIYNEEKYSISSWQKLASSYELS